MPSWQLTVTPLLAVVRLLLTAHAHAAVQTAAAPRPHIVMLLTDNMGWANVGFHRPPDVPAREIHTPNIDQLAASGMILDRHYTCEARIRLTEAPRPGILPNIRQSAKMVLVICQKSAISLTECFAYV